MGMSDGLTVPFALAAGLFGGSMPRALSSLPGWPRRAIEEVETIDMPEAESKEVIFQSYGLPEATVDQVIGAIRSDRKRWFGGLIPLAQYFFVQSVHRAILVSIAVALIALGESG